MKTGHASFDDVRIVGVYATPQRRDMWPRTGFSLALEALRGALDDAGLDVSDIDGIATMVADWPFAYSGSRNRPELFWARQLGRPMRWTNAGHGAPAILDAAAAINSGLASTVAVIVGQSKPPSAGETASWTRPTDEFTEWTGSYTTVQYALVARRYMHEYGDRSLDAMAEAAATIRNYGHVNPDAVYSGRGPFTAQDVLNSRLIASPLTLLMCSAVNDGGGAIILTHKDHVGRRQNGAVRILGGGNQQPYPPYFEVPTLDAVSDASRFAKEAFDRAGVTHDEIDVLELYDHFAIGVLMEFELYGFCAPGEGAEMVRSGALAVDGRFPTSTDGGCLAYSHNGSPALLRAIEAVRQIRGDVRDACPGWKEGVHTHEPLQCRTPGDVKIALASSPGPPTGGGSFVLLAAE